MILFSLARYAGEFVSEMVAGIISTPDRKKKNVEEVKQFGGGR